MPAGPDTPKYSKVAAGSECDDFDDPLPEIDDSNSVAWTEDTTWTQVAFNSKTKTPRSAGLPLQQGKLIIDLPWENITLSTGLDAPFLPTSNQ